MSHTSELEFLASRVIQKWQKEGWRYVAIHDDNRQVLRYKDWVGLPRQGYGAMSYSINSDELVLALANALTYLKGEVWPVLDFEGGVGKAVTLAIST